MKRYAIALTIAASLGASLLGAQEFSGSIEARLGWYWSSTELDSETQVAEGGLDGKLGPEGSPTAQYKLRVKAEYDPSAESVETGTRLKLGEAWVKLFAGPFDLSFGNQVVAWSVSDAFWPSDVVNPWDLSLPVDPARIPVPLARAVWNGGPLSLDLVAQPFWVASILPAARWQDANALAAAGFTLNYVDDKPALKWDNVAYGGHLKASLGLLEGLDLGATFYRGRLSTPSSVVTITGVSSADISLEYDRATVLGADLVLAPGGGLLLKSEWAYTTLNDSSVIEPAAGDASVEGVSGLEFSIGSIQAIGEYVYDWSKGGAASGDSTRHGAVLILSGDLGSRLSLKVAGIYDFSDGGSGMISPQLGYTLADGLTLSCNAYLFIGEAGTRYGKWRDDSLGKVSLKYSF